MNCYSFVIRTKQYVPVPTMQYTLCVHVYWNKYKCENYIVCIHIYVCTNTLLCTVRILALQSTVSVSALSQSQHFEVSDTHHHLWEAGFQNVPFSKMQFMFYIPHNFHFSRVCQQGRVGWLDDRFDCEADNADGGWWWWWWWVEWKDKRGEGNTLRGAVHLHFPNFFLRWWGSGLSY